MAATPLQAIKTTLASLLFLLAIPYSDIATADTAEEDIRARINDYVHGLQNKDVQKVMSIFKSGAIWAGEDICDKYRASTAQTFNQLDNIRVEVQQITFTRRQVYWITSGLFHIRAQWAGTGDTFESIREMRWLWEKTPDGWKVIGSRSLPGPPLQTASGPEPSPTRSANMPISIEVIGFGIKKGSKEERQLRDIAQVGGGNYLAASNAAELTKVLMDAVRKSIEESRPPTIEHQPRVNTWESVGGSDSAIPSGQSRDQPLHGSGRLINPVQPYQKGGWDAIGSERKDFEPDSPRGRDSLGSDQGF